MVGPESRGAFVLIVLGFAGFDGDAILKPDTSYHIGKVLEASRLRQLFSAVSAN